MAGLRALTFVAVAAVFAATVHGQAPTSGSPNPGEGRFPPPQSTPEVVTDEQDFPFLPPLPGARLISTKRVAEPLELRPATADDEAVLAGMSYVQKTYDRPGTITAIVFVSAFRDALFAAGWKLIEVTRLEEIPIQPETVNVAAHYSADGRNLYARLTQEPGGPYQVNVADVGAEDWQTALARDCRVRAPSIQFDLDRATLRPEATPTLEKLAAVLKARSAPAVEVQGHVDNIGADGDAARQVLSEARARAVATWLVGHGVAKGKVSAKGYGKTRPLAANDSDLGRAINRRIEIVRTGCSR
jgi:OmpA-OmpF porin, OOP family